MKHFNLIVSIVLSVAALSMSCSNEQEFEALVIAENEKVLELEPIEELEPETAAEEKPYHYLFTEEAKAEIKRRIEQEYVTGPGFSNDFVTIKESVQKFKADPSIGRPIFGEYDDIPPTRHQIYQAAVYAWAMEDIDLANLIILEISNTVEANSFPSAFWEKDFNWGNYHSMYVQAAAMKKIKDSYQLIKNLQSIHSETELSKIDNFIATFYYYSKQWLLNRFESYFGHDWHHNNTIDSFYPEGLYPSDYGEPNPIEDKNGQDISEYTISWAQDHFNNRNLDIINFIYGEAVLKSDVEIEQMCRAFFKLVIKYGVFPDGTFWEVIRNKSEYHNAIGIYYTNVTLTSLIKMAHIDAMTQHFPNDLLYNYETVEGIVHGSTTLTKEPYAGGSTTDGKTLKSLKTLIIGQSNYLRTEEFGGWADTRFYNGESLNTTGKVQNSVVAALANLYYKDENLKDYYLYNTSKGYPEKQRIGAGYGGYNEDYGAWGNLIAGGLWLEMEPYFFN